MTKVTDSDKQAGHDRPEFETEITPAMIEAGAFVIMQYRPESDSGKELARTVYSAMEHARIRAKTFRVSSTMPIEAPPSIVETINGRIQVSAVSGESRLGIVVERDDLFCGVLVSDAQAKKLARLLLRRDWLRPAIEITEEMISVGARHLIDSGYLLYDTKDGVRLLIREILSLCLSGPNLCENQQSRDVCG